VAKSSKNRKFGQRIWRAKFLARFLHQAWRGRSVLLVVDPTQRGFLASVLPAKGELLLPEKRELANSCHGHRSSRLRPATVTTNLTFLEKSEAAWHADKLQNSEGRRAVVLSHHQLFTAFGDGLGQGNGGKALAYNSKLYSVSQPFVKDIALWLWGHEHNFEVFNPYIGLNKGRCIGAAAIPVLQSQNPYGLIGNPDLQEQKALPALDPRVAQLSLDSDKAYFHDYAVMTLRIPDGASLPSRIDYYELDSCNHGENELMFGEVLS